MLQQVMTEPGKIIFREIETPVPGPGQVLVRIKRIGVCGSDIHVYYGEHKGTGYPVTQGHEVSGQVAGLGEGVTQFRVGQKVTIEPQVVCGKCYPCRHGKYNLCEHLRVMGFQTTGTASEYFAVDAERVTALPDAMTYDEGAMIEPLAVTVHAAKRFAELDGAKVAILGCGPIGILLAQTVKALGAASVLITDISDYRLQLAKECGADFAVNTREKDLGKHCWNALGRTRQMSFMTVPETTSPWARPSGMRARAARLCWWPCLQRKRISTCSLSMTMNWTWIQP